MRGIVNLSQRNFAPFVFKHGNFNITQSQFFIAYSYERQENDQLHETKIRYLNEK